ncbi:uncharacterized protein J4E79_003972 [Alternaria viburni]|uniref:uncharacterized protein n=1 Tax=Alternaria viburni TaxID=566460 RepID=UPI0020C585B1|nr:uncharacterized protein J4E79_003972 [Alternaria viburni]KAI4662663.1 hypothetical protein J4E79_003972 [Alternaria viburni]
MTLSFYLFLVCALTCWSQYAAAYHATSIDTLTVGFALTVDHATATIRHNSTFFEDLPKVEASEEYIKLMQRFSLWSSQHPSPPYASLGDLWNDIPRQRERDARKQKGLPASNDVAVIATLLKAIKDVAEASVGASVSALVSFPALPGLYQEDIVDAAYYIGLERLAKGLARHPHELIAAYAGHGYDLCKSYNPVKRCVPDDGGSFTTRTVLLAEYTQTALLLHLEGLNGAVELSWPNMYLELQFDLGSSRTPDEQDVRNSVLNFLYHHYNERLGRGPPNMTVILVGDPESVGDGKVQRATKIVLEALGAHAEVLAENSAHVAARGAAEMAWRALDHDERMEL